MPQYMTAVPAYGRDYKSKAAVLKDWNDGKDFLIADLGRSAYINKDDKPAWVTLQVRYQKLTKVVMIP